MKILLLIQIGVCGLVLLCSQALAWQTTISGTANGVDEALAVKVDAAGDVVAAGFTLNAGIGGDFTVVKFSGVDGTELWRQAISGSADFILPDMAHAVVVDHWGDVIAAGRTFNTSVLFDFTLVKFSGVDGTELWRQVINGTLNANDTAFAVDGIGDIVAAGFTINIGTGVDLTLVKFCGVDGSELWRQVINGVGGGIDDLALAVKVDREGNVVAGGMVFGDVTVVKFSGADGAELWRQRLGSPNLLEDVARSLTVDATGDVVAAGTIVNPGTVHDFAVVKLSGRDGTERWRQVLSGSAFLSDDAARQVVVDAAGNVVAVGSTQNTDTFYDFTVVKLDGQTGTVRWQHDVDGTANSLDEAVAVAVNSVGDVVAVGGTLNTTTRLDFTAVKFDGVSGTELWRRVISGTANGDNEALAVTVDSAGDVVAAGFTSNTGTGADFTVVKLRGTDGTDFTPHCLGTGAARLRGRVRAAAPTWIAGVTLTLTGPGGCRDTTTTNAQGHYRFRTLGNGPYTVTPTKEGCTFVPADRTVTRAEADHLARFRGTCVDPAPELSMSHRVDLAPHKFMRSALAKLRYKYGILPSPMR